MLDMFFLDRFLIDFKNRDNNKYQGCNSHDKYTKSEGLHKLSIQRKKRNKKRKELKRRKNR